jgi:hypothetical protein
MRENRGKASGKASPSALDVVIGGAGAKTRGGDVRAEDEWRAAVRAYVDALAGVGEDAFEVLMRGQGWR